MSEKQKRRDSKAGVPMNAESLREYADEVLEAVARGKTDSIADAFEYLVALGRDPSPGADARWNMLYFCGNYVSWRFGRDSTDEEANESNAISDADIQELCAHIRNHPLFERLAQTGAAPNKRDMFLAFALLGMSKLVGAGEIVNPEHFARLRGPDWPREFEERGLFADGQATAKFRESFELALVCLRPDGPVWSAYGCLTRDEKVDLLELLFETAIASSQDQPVDFATLQEHVNMIGITGEELRALALDVLARQDT